jgi:hypothetical protein
MLSRPRAGAKNRSIDFIYAPYFSSLGPTRPFFVLLYTGLVQAPFLNQLRSGLLLPSRCAHRHLASAFSFLTRLWLKQSRLRLNHLNKLRCKPFPQL